MLISRKLYGASTLNHTDSRSSWHTAPNSTTRSMVTIFFARRERELVDRPRSLSVTSLQMHHHSLESYISKYTCTKSQRCTGKLHF